MMSVIMLKMNAVSGCMTVRATSL